jgi:hypothetical protein
MKYKFRNYTPDMDKAEPLIVFGVYTKTVTQWLMNHTGLIVIVWSGGDAMHLKKWMYFTNWCKANSDRVFHIAYSHWIKSDLDAVGLGYIERPVFPVTFDWLKFESEQGTKIYHYHSRSKGLYGFYGTDVVNELEKRKKIPFVKTAFGHVKLQSPEMYDYYKSCHTGVRLTWHDNMSLSCIEMALMGRKSIFNGNIPGAIPYADKEEAVKLILEAHKEQPPPDKLLAEETKEFVYDDEKWLDTKFYES